MKRLITKQFGVRSSQSGEKYLRTPNSQLLTIIIAIILALPSQASALRPMAKAVSVKTYIPERRQRLLDIIEYKKSKKPDFKYKKAQLFLTRYCNMRCKICFSNAVFLRKNESFKDPNLYFTKERLQQLIKFLNESKIESLEITGGGEPFLNDETISMLIEIIKHTKIKEYSVVTNCLWATNMRRANGIIKRLDRVLKKYSVKEFHFASSMREGRGQMATGGIANMLIMFTNSKGQIFSNTSSSFELIGTIDMQSSEAEKITEKLFTKIKEKLLAKSKNKITLDVKAHDIKLGFVAMKIDKRRDVAMWYIAVKECKQSGKRPFEWHLHYRLQQIEAEGRAKNIQKESKRPNELFHSGLKADKLFIDTDGSVVYMCRAKISSLAFVLGNISEGLSVIEERRKKDPLCRAFQEKVGTYLYKELGKIKPRVLKNINGNNCLGYELERILDDEELRTRLTLAVLKRWFWDDLTKRSQQEIEEFMAREGIQINKSFSKEITPISKEESFKENLRQLYAASA
ncbi:MAG: 4Fe-4S cluster-binding domain-containing protein [Candidatus Omnitrophota bacterium]